MVKNYAYIKNIIYPRILTNTYITYLRIILTLEYGTIYIIFKHKHQTILINILQ